MDCDYYIAGFSVDSLQNMGWQIMAQIERELKTKLVAALASIAVETPNEAEMELADAVMTVIVERSDSNAFRVAWLYIQNRGEQAFKARVSDPLSPS